MDYLVYAYLQLGQDKKAKAVVDEMKTVTGFTETFLPGPYALAASPARYAVERGDWKAAAELAGPAEPARARAGDHAFRARARRRPLGQCRRPPKPTSPSSPSCATSCAQAKDAYWSEQVDIQAQVASAWALHAEGKHDEALKAMSAAADAEDKTEKHPVTPGVPKPARELYGVMLLERGMAKEALAAFEATLKKEPNRLGAYVGAAKAAEKAGDVGQGARLLQEGRRARERSRRDPHRRGGRARVPQEALTRGVVVKHVPRALVALAALGVLAAPAGAEP